MKIRKLLSTMALSALVASNAFATEPVKVEWGDVIKQPWGDPSDPEGANVCSWFQWGQDLWFDYNNDGYPDRFLIGGKHQDMGHAYLFRNEEGSEFTNIPVNIPKLEIAGAVVLDFDNDGIMDLYVQGKKVTDNGEGGQNRENYTAIWRGTGDPDNPFEHAVQQEIDELGIGESEGQHRGYFCAAGDYDNDGWTDLFMTGWARKDESWHVILYRNNQGVFEEVQNPVGEDGEGIEPFKTITTGSVYLSDLNKDGYLDLIVSGNDQTNGWIATTTIYFNNGDGTFRETTQQGFFEGELRFGKYLSYKQVYSLIFRNINKVAEMSGIKKKVTYYSARKTFAQHGYNLGIQIEKIEYCIGHSMKSNRPIFNYIKIMQEHADKVFREILDQLLGTIHLIV